METRDALEQIALVLTEHIFGTERRERTRCEVWDIAHRVIAERFIAAGVRNPIDIGTGNEAALARTLVASAANAGRAMFVTTLDNNRRNVLAAQRNPSIRFLWGDAASPLAFPPHSFDGLSSSFCLEYLSNEAIGGAFGEFARVLAPRSPISIAVYGNKAVEQLFLLGLQPALYDGWSLKSTSFLSETLRLNGFSDIETAYFETGVDEALDDVREIAVVSALSPAE